MQKKTQTLFAGLGFDIDPLQTMSVLNLEERQLVGIAKALLYDARIIIFDETHKIFGEKNLIHFFRILKKLKQEHKAILFNTYKIDEVFRIADKVTVLRGGRIVKTASVSEINNKALFELMTGSKPKKSSFVWNIRKPGNELFRIKDYTDYRHIFHNIDFSVREGEILAIIGGSIHARFAKKEETKDSIQKKQRVMDSDEILSKEDAHTKFGRYVYAIGDNEQAAYLSGIHVKKYKTLVYTYAGFLAALADVDIHGPNIPWIFGLHTTVFPTEEDRVTPVQSALGIKIASVGALGYDENTAFIWRGPMKLGVIKQFLSEVDWGDLDVLLIDTPPGTGDELMTVAEHIPDLDGCIVVTTPQALAVLDARKSISFARKFNIQVYGIVENMSDTKTQKMFGTGGGQRAAQELGQHFLGNVACDPSIVEMCNGKIENISVSVLPVSVIEALV
ncbi:hypothetical protein LSH36_793g01256 [Paralvinella palmiformis]|uniref:Uncharacterized protein n=1 Tax=Paralvinella palmiformis TaxID=53620 RepID=A0AAD9MSD4_9ANNE|nr:hypothetical protein LSH36_793g01256 [Paralvinella palmiformis]